MLDLSLTKRLLIAGALLALVWGVIAIALIGGGQ